MNQAELELVSYGWTNNQEATALASLQRRQNELSGYTIHC